MPKENMGGEPNYITREGARKLQEELADLRSRQRPKIVQEVADAAAQGDRSENAEYIYGKRKLREIDRRMHWLTRRLESATVVEPRAPDGKGDRVFFGAVVEVEDEDGARSTYRIVGEDEIDLKRGHISWRSPLGRVLLKRTTGDAVLFRRPSGEIELTIISVRY
ncbi:MAG TPA: transcription elongation factor GreB [Polyangiaceae bacterium]|nr:transcription elongation factor GreB [Polyangiaceae bacterium]